MHILCVKRCVVFCMLSSLLCVEQCVSMQSVMCWAVCCPNKEELTRAAKQLLPFLATLDWPSLIISKRPTSKHGNLAACMICPPRGQNASSIQHQDHPSLHLPLSDYSVIAFIAQLVMGKQIGRIITATNFHKTFNPRNVFQRHQDYGHLKAATIYIWKVTYTYGSSAQMTWFRFSGPDYQATQSKLLFLVNCIYAYMQLTRTLFLSVPPRFQINMNPTGADEQIARQANLWLQSKGTEQVLIFQQGSIKNCNISTASICILFGRGET